MFSYPEWYNIEKQTEKTIQKLTSTRELSFYLSNADESIRRLAIARLGRLAPRDCIAPLRTVLDDPLESEENRNLAAWAIKAAGTKNDMDVFLSHRLLARYTGDEEYDDLFKITVKDSYSTPKLEFQDLSFEARLIDDLSEARSSQGLEHHIPFSSGLWLKSLFTGFVENLATFSSQLLSKAAKLPALVFSRVKRRGCRTGKTGKYIAPNTGLRSDMPSKSGILLIPQAVKKALIILLRIVFYPLKLILSHKKAVFAAAAAVYCLLSFTPYGRILSYKYLGFDPVQVQKSIFNSASEIVAYARSELEYIAKAGKKPEAEQEVKAVQPPEQQPDAKQFVVTAKTGLNLRRSPDPAAEKVSNNSLPYNSRVTYLSKSHKDPEGRLWYYVRTPDGATGWAYSKWLRETGGEQIAAR